MANSMENNYIHPDNARIWPFPEVSSFRNWLSSLPEDFVFRLDGIQSGPIWYFLRRHGWENPSVFAHGYWHPTYVESGTKEEFRMPSWAAEFSWMEVRIKSRTLSVKECLDLLENPIFDPSRWDNGRSRPTIRLKQSI